MVKAPAERRVRHTLAVISIAAAMMGTAISASPPLAPVVSAATTCTDGWQRSDLPTDVRYVSPLGSGSLYGQPAWLVGIPVSKLANQRPTIARWVDGVWQTVTPPWSKYGGLTAVQATSATSAWAVGAIGGQVTETISTVWDGTAWGAVKTPKRVGQSATLTDLSLIPATGRPWAVGAQLINGQTKPLALWRNVAKWAKASPTVPANAEGGLSGVDIAPDGRVWAVGWRTVNGAVSAWILYRSGTRWQDSPPAPAGLGLALLTDVVFLSANDGWVVGAVERAGGGYTPLIQHWDGSTWSNEAAPWGENSSVIIRAATVDGAGRLAVTGALVGNGQPRAVFALRAADGWHVRTEAATAYPGSWMVTLAGLSSGALAGGNIDYLAATLMGCEASGPTLAKSGSTPASMQALDEDIDSPPAGVSLSQPVGQAYVDPGLAAAVGVRVVDRSSSAGLGMSIVTYGGIAADFNGDTWPDLFINRHLDGVPLLLMGGPTGFADSNAPFAMHDRHDCAAADVNADQVLDVFCAIGAGRGTRTSVKELLLGVGSRGGVVATQEFGLLDAFGRGRNAVFLNANRDQYLDLFTTSEPTRIDGMPSLNRLYLNDGGRRFLGAPGGAVDGSAGGACARAADIDLDGDDDLLTCVTEPTNVLLSGARIYINDNGVFSDRTTARGVIPFTDTDLAVADFDGDGWPDLAQLRGGALRISLGNRSGFTQVFETATFKGVSLAVGDVNGDGRPDLYVAQAYPDHVVFVNDGTGHSFSRLDILNAGSSSTERVLALDYDHNGLTDFVVLNGRYAAGPVRLMSFEEAP